MSFYIHKTALLSADLISNIIIVKTERNINSFCKKTRRKDGIFHVKLYPFHRRTEGAGAADRPCRAAARTGRAAQALRQRVRMAGRRRKGDGPGKSMVPTNTNRSAATPSALSEGSITSLIPKRWNTCWETAAAHCSHRRLSKKKRAPLSYRRKTRICAAFMPICSHGAGSTERC